MWSKLREAVAGIAGEAGIEIPGLDSATTALSDLTGSVDPTELAAGATDAVAGAGETASGVLGEASSAASGVLGEASATASGLLDGLKGHLAP
jgi:hypothetical protein